MGDSERFRAAEQRLWASTGLIPEERSVSLPRCGVTVRVQEVGDGPPLLFLHGGVNSGVSWAPLTARLAGFRCILLDRPGCGLSDPLPTPLDVDALRAVAHDLIADVLDALDLPAADVVATSLGGFFAFHGAAAHPARVRRIVAFGWSAGSAADRVPWFMRLNTLPGAAAFMGAIPPTERGVRAMLRRVGLRGAVDSGRFSPEMVASYTALLRDTPTMRNDGGASRHLPLHRPLDDRLALSDSVLSDVLAPVHLLWGEEDPFGGPATARAFADRLPSAELELIPAAGHAVWVDDPDHAAAFVTRALQA